MTFKEIYDKTPDDFKTDFLYQVLNENSRLKNKFLESIPSVKEVATQEIIAYDDFKNMVDAAYNDFLELLQDIDLANLDWEDYTPSHSGYIPEWEALTELGEQEVENVLGGFKDEMISKLLQGNITEIVSDFLAFYQAAADADIDDPEYCFETINDYLVDTQLREWIMKAIGKIPFTRLNDDNVINVIKLFFEYYHNNKQDNLNEIRFFEDFLISILDSISDKSKILYFEQFSKIDKKYCPLFVSAVMKYNTGNNNREAILRELMFTDKNIGEELLKYYLENKETGKYLETAKQLYETDKEFWAQKVCSHISPDDDRDFFVEVNFQCYLKTAEITYYKKIKSLLSSSEKENFINRIHRNTLLKIKIYEVDKEFDKIKEIVNKIDVDSWYFSKEIMLPIINVYQEFCFNKIAKKIDKIMSGEKRNRYSYQNIVEWIFFAEKVPAHRDSVEALVNKLYTHKPPLPALKDEFRKAGLVDKF